MSGEPPRAEGEELEILLKMNEQLRAEVRAHGKRKSRRYLGSLTVLGVIIGYVFATNGDGRVLVLAPYVLAFLYLSQISSMNYVMQLAALIALIEAKINFPGAEYEAHHGGFNISQNPRFDSIEEFDEVDPPRSYVARIRRAAQKWTLRRIDGSHGDPEVLQNVVQSRVRDGMHGLAVIAYFGSGFLGVGVLLQSGVPELGLSNVPHFALEPAALAAVITDPVTVIGVTLIVSQGYLFYHIAIAWGAYKQHVRVVRENVRDILGADNFDDRFGDGLRSHDAFSDSE